MCLFLICSAAQVSAMDDRSELAALLDRFLQGASVNDARMHDRFWHPDLIYTSSAGQRFGKAEIMQGLAESESSESGATPRYWAEDVHVRDLGETFLLSFRLMAEMPADDGTDTRLQQYLNTGVFVEHGGLWQAISWQVTRVGDDD